MAIDPSPETLAAGYVKIARSLRPTPRSDANPRHRAASTFLRELADQGPVE